MRKTSRELNSELELPVFVHTGPDKDNSIPNIRVFWSRSKVNAIQMVIDARVFADICKESEDSGQEENVLQF